MDTAGRHDELLLGLQLDEDQELEQILEKEPHPWHGSLCLGLQPSPDTKSRKLRALPARSQYATGRG